MTAICMTIILNQDIIEVGDLNQDIAEVVGRFKQVIFSKKNVFFGNMRDLKERIYQIGRCGNAYIVTWKPTFLHHFNVKSNPIILSNEDRTTR